MTGRVPILVVAHQSPPLGGPGVRRLASWLRGWPACGIEPLLVTAPPDDGARAHGYPLLPDTERELLSRALARTPTPPVGGFAGLLLRTGLPRRVPWTLCHGRMREPETPWGDPAANSAIDLARRGGARAVVSTSQPYVDHAVGFAVARALSIPWIADFRDPMTEAEGRWWPSRLHWWAERRLERRWIEAATLVWATSEAAAARWRERLPACAAKILVRRNGVGPADPLSLPAAPSAPPLRIGHAGRFTDRAASSRLRFLDWRPGKDSGTGSSPEPLFRALAAFLAKTPEARGNVMWVTAGDPGPAPPEGVAAEPHGALPNAEALAVLASCHALYLPLTTPPPYGSLVVPQKAYEYAALGRPVLVSGTRREATDVLGPLALLAEREPVAEMAAHVARLWAGDAARPPRPQPAPRTEDVARACADDVLRVVGQAPSTSR